MLIGTEEEITNGDVWIGDTGTTSHMRNDLSGMYDLEDINQWIILGDGKKLLATKKGKLNVSTTDMDGKEVSFTIENVKFAEGLWRKLFSLSVVLKKGAKIVSEGCDLVLTKGRLSFKFKEIDTGGLIGVRFKI